MRYLDWDVLLFPVGEAGHVPMKEFNTKCYLEEIAETQNQVPLLTTFVPSLAAGAPFQVSVHSWTRTQGMLGSFPDGTKTQEFWQVRIVIDGEVVGVKHFDAAAMWPQIVSTIGSPSMGGALQQLRFPAMPAGFLREPRWNGADREGRIRVELSSGYLLPKIGRYNKLVDVVTFAFQAVPLEILEKCGIAWPNAAMMDEPIMATAPPLRVQMPALTGEDMFAVKHKDNGSFNSMTLPALPMALPVARPNSPLNPNTDDPNSNYDDSSRSTSAYSIMPEYAGPMLRKGLFHPMPVYAAPSGAGQSNGPLSVRLPSDQIQRIVDALDTDSKSPQTQQASNPASTMPPPPLPQHVVTARADSPEPKNVTTKTAAPPASPNASASALNRRGESNYSDVSMHNNCASFPACTTEDDNGHVVHNPPSTPATTVKGKKEGSSAAKPRDFFSTILDTPVPRLPTATELSPPKEMSGLLSSSPAGAQARKRARSALKSLNLNDASPVQDSSVSKPARNASRSVSSAKSNKENMLHEEDDMMMDA